MGDFVIGQAAAIYWSDYGDGRATRTTIERDTKLYWIADGRKFRKSDGVEPGSGSNWGRIKYLLPVSDPKVIQAEAAAQKAHAYGRVVNAQNHLASHREDPEAIAALRVALDAYAEVLQP